MKKVIGLGSPIIDEIAFVGDEFLKKLGGSKGGMELINENELVTIQNLLSSSKLTRQTGGSAGNTIFALAKLGIPTKFISKLGNCKSGNYYKNSFSKIGGDTTSFKIGSKKNGTCISLVTPDGERTMKTFLGAASELDSSELNDTDFFDCRHLHIEGFMIHNKSVLYKALEIGKSRNCTISFDLASFEIVQQYKDELKVILNDYVDMVFANIDEVTAFTGLGHTNAEKSAIELNQLCSIAAVKLGAKGSIISTKGNIFKIDAIPTTNILDTTAAGDYWAAGFIFGIITKKSIEDSAYYASLMASKVIKNQGACLTEDDWIELGNILSCNQNIH